MNDIAKFRAEKFNDCSLWSAEDALEDAKDRIKGRNVMLAIHWWEIEEDGTRAHCFSAYNMTHQDHIALLELAKMETLEEWFGS